MAAQAALQFVIEIGQYRPADDVGAGRLGHRIPSAPASPARRFRRRRSSGNWSPPGTSASAVSNAALIAWQLPWRGSTTHSPANFPDAEKFGGDRNALALQRIVLDHDDGEAAVGALIGQRLQRPAQMLRPAKAGDADDDFDRRDRAPAKSPPARAAACRRISAFHRGRSLVEISAMTLMSFTNMSHRPEPGWPAVSRDISVLDMIVRSGIDPASANDTSAMSCNIRSGGARRQHRTSRDG